jgi:hypothetical protein
MFKALADHARRAPIVIMITTEGEHLRVTIQQKEVKAGRIPLSISVAQTPELLDAELPAAIAEAYAAAPNAEPVAEQVHKQVASAASSAAAKSEKKPEKKKARPDAVKNPVKPKPAKAEKPKPAKKSPASKPTKHIASKPTKEQCIAAYHAYAAANPGDIKREPFIKGNPTGRRFERLFGNWEKFVAAAMKTGTLNPPGDTKTKPLPLTGMEQLAQDMAHVGYKPAKVNTDGKGPVTGIGFTLWHDVTDQLVSGVIRNEAPAVGEIIKIHDDSEWLVMSVDDNRLRVRCYTPPASNVAPGLPESWPFPVPQQTAAAQAPCSSEAKPEATEISKTPSDHSTSVPPTPAGETSTGEDVRQGEHRGPAQPAPAAATNTTGRTVITTEGVLLAGGMHIAAETGMEINIPSHGNHRITDFDDQQIIVEPITEGATA